MVVKRGETGTYVKWLQAGIAHHNDNWLFFFI